MARIGIEYCVECMFLGRALEIAKLLLEKFPQEIESLELIPGTDGAFLITLDGEPVYRISADGRLPAPDEIKRRLESKLRMHA